MPRQAKKTRVSKTTDLECLRRDLEAYSKQDQADHAKLYSAIGDVKKDVGNAAGQLTVISGILEEQRDERRVQRQNELSTKKFRRNLILKVATIVGAAAAGLTHLLHRLLS